MTAAEILTSRSPQRPDDIVLETGSTSPEEIRRYVASARSAGSGWRAQSPAVRSAALDGVADGLAARAEEFAALMVREVGKSVTEARAEVTRGVSILRYFAQQVFDPLGHTHAPAASGLLFTLRRPHGVAGLVTPWNFPVAIPLWKAAPALAFGNGVVLKPAPAATATAMRLRELFDDALPDGLLHVAPGGAETGAALVDGADCVSFTGSTRIGRAVVSSAAGRGAPVQAEMGGQNAAVVFSDADPQLAADDVAAGAFSYSGQKCTATRRIVLVGDCSEFVEALVKRAGEIRMGDPADASTIVGPVIDATARDNATLAVTEAVRDGGRMLAGGRAVPAEGYYVAPTVIDGLPAEHRLCREEVFAPICSVLRVADDDEALRVANSVRYGLVTGVYTRDLDRALRFVDAVEAGVVKVNAPTTGVDFHLPFGGDKDSSYGPREQGKAARDFYTHSRTVMIAPASR